MKRKTEFQNGKMSLKCFQALLIIAVIIPSFLNVYYGGMIAASYDSSKGYRPTIPSKQFFSWDKNPNRTITVDILSIGSQRRIDLQKHQIETFGSHRTVRTFFLADERADSDPKCSQTLTFEDTLNISHFCLNKEYDKDKQRVLWEVRPHYIDEGRLRSNQNPVGWLCAQARPLHALYQVQRYYLQHSLPDYFILLDDDTYYNMYEFQKHFSLEGSSKPRAISGCVIRFGRGVVNFPYGGFGLIFSRSLLQIIMTPIQCTGSWQNPIVRNISGKPQPPTQQELCRQVSSNGIGEYPVFQKKMESGISLVELMKDYADESSFSNYKNWDTGYCLHSDWATGYFTSLLTPEIGENFQAVPLRAYNTHPGMRSVFNRRFKYDTVPLNMCRYEKENCTAKSEVCHYANTEIMTKRYQEQKKVAPKEFGRKPFIVELRGSGQ